MKINETYGIQVKYTKRYLKWGTFMDTVGIPK